MTSPRPSAILPLERTPEATLREAARHALATGQAQPGETTEEQVVARWREYMRRCPEGASRARAIVWGYVPASFTGWVIAPGEPIRFEGYVDGERVLHGSLGDFAWRMLEGKRHTGPLLVAPEDHDAQCQPALGVHWARVWPDRIPLRVDPRCRCGAQLTGAAPA